MTASPYESFVELSRKHVDVRSTLFAMVEAQAQNKLSEAEEERLVGRAFKAIIVAGEDSDKANEILTDMIALVNTGDSDRKAINKFYAELIAELDLQRTPKDLTLDPFFAARMNVLAQAESMDMHAVERKFLEISASERMQKQLPEMPLAKAFGGRLSPRFRSKSSPPTPTAKAVGEGMSATVNNNRTPTL